MHEVMEEVSGLALSPFQLAVQNRGAVALHHSQKGKGIGGFPAPHVSVVQGSGRKDLPEVVENSVLSGLTSQIFFRVRRRGTEAQKQPHELGM